ncbi:hypothetical protein [Pseudomonas syringae group sp. 243L2]|uniref:hypothetical protein n=1 Tax=Pseudomonas syringae group sp. 243L2 TaxID=3079593 RepID=UPI00290EE313|nr:hypothetical protein [Pseudomonas syringae group sp. 243L2]MDU8630761.1 hypothetical protein [Pseudomonas syringae group sp. 243L2]
MANFNVELAEAIKKAGWWQGSVISGERLQSHCGVDGDIWWIVASQTCNIYNSDFEKIPVVEVVAATRVAKIDNALSKGNNPRLLHLEAIGKGETVFFEVNIQRRIWISRDALAGIGDPDYDIVDSDRESAGWMKSQWLDTFSGWLARSYTRITLPDEFNVILKESRIQEVLDGKILRTDKLYGIYLNIGSASNDRWTGALGLMPAPYFLEILLVTDEDENPIPLVDTLKKSLFEEKVKFKFHEEVYDFRSKIASDRGITIIPEGITGSNIAETSILSVKSSVRYTLNDFLSLSNESDLDN